MSLKWKITLLSLLLFLTCISTEAQFSPAVFDVAQYGVKDGGDISQALMNAWNEACASIIPSKVVIPEGTYFLGQVIVEGPCRAPIEVDVLGSLNAPADPNHFMPEAAWITFQHINHFTLSGTGMFNGQGRTSRALLDCAKSEKCDQLPDNIKLNFVSNGIVRDITSEDSKLSHINIFQCNNISLRRITISAPEYRLNTDGIRITQSTAINITDTKVATGGDCVSIQGGSKQVNVKKVTCGPGQGITVGSLGKYGDENSVIGISIKNCTLGNTINGVKITTLPAAPGSVVRGIQFDDIVMDNVSNPIIIDQEYSPNASFYEQNPSVAKISNVRFRNIRGTSASQVAVKIGCSSSLTCQDVEIVDIDLVHKGNAVTSKCHNVKPVYYGKQNPPACVAASN